MPNRFRLPPELEEAMLVTEIGYPPEVLDNMSQGLVERILIYKGVKNVAENGGDWQP
jgi:hypothetical protein